MIKKEWWLAAGAVSAAMSGQNAAAQNAAPDRAGVAAAVNPSASGQLAGGPSRVMVVASDVFRDEHIVTDAGGQVHLLFLDESALTVGPNSEVVLDKFVYDPQSNTGELALTATRGALRFIGGKLSKVNPIEIHTQTATIGVRGGSLFLYDINETVHSFTAILVAGISAYVRDAAGNQVILTKLGTGLTFDGTKLGSVFTATPAMFRTASDKMKGPPKGTPGLVTAATTGVSNQNTGLPPAVTEEHKIIGDLSAVTNANANAPRALGGGFSATAAQQLNSDKVESQSPSNNYPQ